MTYTCRNRPEPKKTLIVQNGWDMDVFPPIKKWLEIPFVMSHDCRYDKRDTDPDCQSGCPKKTDEEYLKRMGLK